MSTISVSSLKEGSFLNEAQHLEKKKEAEKSTSELWKHLGEPGFSWACFWIPLSFSRGEDPNVSWQLRTGELQAVSKGELGHTHPVVHSSTTVLAASAW